MISNVSILNQYSDYLLPKYSNFPQGRYVSLLLVRKTESETIFRTEGSGEGLVKETVIAGIQNTKPIRRVVISKRKQTAVERRTGREMLREYDLLKKDLKGHVCTLNANAPCGKCIDCMLYGYAVGGGGVAAESCPEPGVRACATRSGVPLEESVRPVVPAEVAPEAKRNVAHTAVANVRFRIVKGGNEADDGVMGMRT